jgi:hypothetical protein
MKGQGESIKDRARANAFGHPKATRKQNKREMQNLTHLRSATAPGQERSTSNDCSAQIQTRI